MREGLYQATHYSFGTSASIFGSFPISISGKTGTAEKSIDPGDGYPATVQPVLVVRVRPVRLARSRCLRADRKRWPRRRRRCAGRAQGLRILLRQASDRHRPDPQRLMVDHYVSNARAAARARRREAVEVASFVRRLDWLLLGSVAAVVGYGLWAIAGITHHDVTGNPGYYLTRQAVYVFIGVVCLVVAVLVDPELLSHAVALDLRHDVFLIAIVLLTGPIRGSKRWLDLGFFRFQPSEFGKVLFVLALAGFLAERSRRLNDIRTTLTALGLASIPVFLVFLQPDFGSALVYCAAVFAVLFVAGTPWTHIAAPRGRGGCPCRAGARRAPRRRPADSQGLPAAASDQLPESRPGPRWHDLQHHAVEERDRCRRATRPRRRQCDADHAQLPARASHGLRLRLARRGAWLLRRVDLAHALSARGLARLANRHASRATRSRRSSRAGSCSRCCSRSSSTSA